MRVLDDFSSGTLDALRPFRRHIQIQRGDVRRFADCAKAMRGVSIVFHQAAYNSVPKSFLRPLQSSDVIATGTLNMLEAFRRQKGDRFVFASSCAVYGPPAELPINESHPLSPLSPYGAAKLSAEIYLRLYRDHYGSRAVALRYFNVYGPGQRVESSYSAVIPAFIQRLSIGREPVIYGDGTQSRDFVYVDDVVRANLRAAEVARPPEILNIASGCDVSVMEICRTLTKMIAPHIRPVFRPRRAADPRRVRASITRATKALNWTPSTPLLEGLKRTLEGIAG